jgi:outer membrane immunogenic protein
MRKLGFLALCGLMAASVPVVAQDGSADHTGWYIGGLLGSADTEIDGFDKSASLFGIYGGYNFTNWLGLEGTFAVTDDVGDDYGTASFGSLSIAPKFTGQITDKFGLFAKVGLSSFVFVYESDYSSEDASFGGIVPYYALGAELSINSVKLRLSYSKESGELEDSEDNYADADAELTAISLGVHYQF